jgi:hypothetical protein
MPMMRITNVEKRKKDSGMKTRREETTEKTKI